MSPSGPNQGEQLGQGELFYKGELLVIPLYTNRNTDKLNNGIAPPYINMQSCIIWTGYTFVNTQSCIIWTGYTFVNMQSCIIWTGYTLVNTQSCIIWTGYTFVNIQSCIIWTGYTFANTQSCIIWTGYTFVNIQSCIIWTGYTSVNIQSCIIWTGYTYVNIQSCIVFVYQQFNVQSYNGGLVLFGKVGQRLTFFFLTNNNYSRTKWRYINYLLSFVYQNAYYNGGWCYSVLVKVGKMLIFFALIVAPSGS